MLLGTVAVATVLGSLAIAGAADASEVDLEAADARALVSASATLDPAVLRARPGDSTRTREARAHLAVLAERLQAVVARYEEAAASASAAQRRERGARAALAEAVRASATAARRYRADRKALVAMVNGAYVTGSLGAVGMVLACDNGGDLVTSMTIADQVNLEQSAVVGAARRSAERLAVAESQASRRAEATRDAAASHAEALDAARGARQEVVDDVAAARGLLEEAVLADEMESALSAASRAGTQGARGAVVFPLAPGAPFVDQRNFGGRGARWALFHTGNDLSAACGTPVVAATAGTVEVRTDQPWSGRWLVIVRSGSGTVATWYAHLESLSVAHGQQVRAGQVIGEVGSEGNSTGCHLHFEYHPAGGSIYEDAADPVAWLRAVGASG